MIKQDSGDNWNAYNADCIEVLRNLPSESIDYSIFSPPFASLFTYSNSSRDMGNSKSNEDFFKHFDFVIKELHRILLPGRLISIHCMNLPMTITKDGQIGMIDFRGDIIRAFQKHDFVYYSEVCIWKDPLLQAVRTKKLELAHKQISKDSSRCAMGYPDYIVTVRKKGDNKKPVSHGRGFERYIGEMEEPKEKKDDVARTNKYSHHVWQRYASPVWFDIRQTNTLNIQQARSKDDEKHICPLQLDVIERCLELWSKKDDVVLSPFMGIGSEGYMAIQNNRKFIGIELKESYYNVAIKNLMNIEKKEVQLSLGVQ
ncbi:MAG: site-specific DNA-methyltransferase [Desulfobacteraceae bacterium]|nr:site-specific DNA-methyltransferase [Desulfobacteraceae bacterium]